MILDPQISEPFHFAAFCPAEKSLLAVIRSFTANVAELIGFGADDALKIELAVDEVCSNVACHARGDDERDGTRIELSLWLDPEGLRIRVRDNGKGAAPERLSAAGTLEDFHRLDRAGYDGMGMLVVRQCMDEVAVDTRPGQGTTITMRKKLGSPAVSTDTK